MTAVLFLFIVINLISFSFMGMDKWKAIHHGYRIRESTLLLTAICMGASGVMVGMLLFRHKIRKISFLFVVPVCVILQIFLLLLIYS